MTFSASFRVISSHRCQDHPTREEVTQLTWQENCLFFRQDEVPSVYQDPRESLKGEYVCGLISSSPCLSWSLIILCNKVTWLALLVSRRVKLMHWLVERLETCLRPLLRVLPSLVSLKLREYTTDRNHREGLGRRCQSLLWNDWQVLSVLLTNRILLESPAFSVF